MTDAWITIPAGAVMVNMPVRNRGFNLFAKRWEAQSVDVPAFDIGKYPVTVADYELFIQDGGYQNAQWWAGLAQRIATAESLPEFSTADHPRVNVTWYEAMAYCRWLSDKTGHTIQLPTEPQWSRAAQGDDNRLYPWGDEWDDNRCNWLGGVEEGGTTPITAYEGADKGDSPFQVVDMLGNVWEWCLSEYFTGSPEVAGKDKRVLKGGSWDRGLEFVRLTFRSSDFPYITYGDVGFRCVRLP